MSFANIVHHTKCLSKYLSFILCFCLSFFFQLFSCRKLNKIAQEDKNDVKFEIHEIFTVFHLFVAFHDSSLSPADPEIKVRARGEGQQPDQSQVKGGRYHKNIGITLRVKSL